MALLQIPTRTDLDNYSEVVVLQNVTYTFNFAWNYRASYWGLTILDPNGNQIVAGVALRINVNILGIVSDPLKPPGQLAVVDTSGAGLDPGLNDLGGRVVLLYNEA